MYLRLDSLTSVGGGFGFHQNCQLVDSLTSVGRVSIFTKIVNTQSISDKIKMVKLTFHRSIFFQ